MSRSAAPPRLHAWIERQMERPGVYSRIQRLVGNDRLWTRFVAEAVRPFRGMRMLDVGCGPADVLGYLPPDVDYLGIDLHPPYLVAAARRHPRKTFREVRVEALPDAEYDVVLLAGVLHHLDDETARAMARECRRLLAPGGRLLALEPLRRAGRSWLEEQAYAIDRGKHVRADYRPLLTAFSQVNATPWERMLRLPYTYVVLEARR